MPNPTMCVHGFPLGCCAGCSLGVLPGNPGSDWTPADERALVEYAQWPDDTHATWGGPHFRAAARFAREILRLRAELEAARSPSGTGSAMPMQPTFIDQHGTRRFRANAIVRHLLDAGPLDMNALASVPGNSEVYAGGFPREDWEQFAQLIGYSLGGFSELSYVSDAAYERAEGRSPEVEEAGEDND